MQLTNAWVMESAEPEITVGHFSTNFRDLAEQIQFARTNLLHIFSGEANNSLNGRPISNPYFKL